ncbi:MAG: ATP-binding cassette domain-containing protein [Spirochaetaceae bacterium]|jgi:ABC-2 type transport system ATP-binding protein|nr:ATP-binding cassette domain-containing protein [Spirochaetaceae bacterium]
MQLQMENIRKNFRDKEVLKGITVRMENGVYGLLGPNGAGKTTMIRILADILQPSEGRVLINGQDKNTCGDDYRAKIGYLPQDMHFYADFSGLDYLQYVAALKGIPPAAAKTRIDELAASVGLSGDVRRRCVHYSGGMKRRLGIAQALLNDPHILILDEPTAGLDPQERIKFRNIISAFSKDRIVLLSTHIVSDVDSIAKEIMMMEYGSIRKPQAGEEYIRLIENRVWTFQIPVNDLIVYQHNAVISNVVPRGKNMEVRVIDDEKPNADAVPVPPNLEDAYLYIFNYLPGKYRGGHTAASGRTNSLSADYD